MKRIIFIFIFCFFALPVHSIDRQIVVPPNQYIKSRLNADIISNNNKINETITTQLVDDWVYQGYIIAPENSLIIGTISGIVPPQKALSSAKVYINFNKIIKPDNTEIQIRTKTICITNDEKLKTQKVSQILINNFIPTFNPRSFYKGAYNFNSITQQAIYSTNQIINSDGDEVKIPFGTKFNIQILTPVTVQIN